MREVRMTRIRPRGEMYGYQFSMHFTPDMHYLMGEYLLPEEEEDLDKTGGCWVDLFNPAVRKELLTIETFWVSGKSLFTIDIWVVSSENTRTSYLQLPTWSGRIVKEGHNE